jgi:hypothetical protein
MLRISNMEGSTFPGRVLFPTCFAPRGMSQGFKAGGVPPARLMPAGVEVGGGKGVSLKTLEPGIENSRDLGWSDSVCGLWRAWGVYTEEVQVCWLSSSHSSTAQHPASQRVVPKLPMLREGKDGRGEKGEDIMRKSVMVVVRRDDVSTILVPICFSWFF